MNQRFLFYEHTDTGAISTFSGTINSETNMNLIDTNFYLAGVQVVMYKSGDKTNTDPISTDGEEKTVNRSFVQRKPFPCVDWYCKPASWRRRFQGKPFLFLLH